MFAGLGVATNRAPLDDNEEERLEEHFVFLSMAPSEYNALPKEQRMAVAALMQSWHLNKLLLTRTATKKQ